MTAVCGCGHPHLPGQAFCYLCELPTNVPPAVEQPPAPAGGAQAQGGSDG